MHHACVRLLTAFVEEHLPGIDSSDLLAGHHSDLDPYFPDLLVGEAERMAQLLGPERDRFAGLDQSGFIRALIAGDAPHPFIAAIEAHCELFGLLPPSQFENDAHNESWQTVDILRLIRSSLKSGRRVQEMNDDTMRRREEVVAGVHKRLADQPEAWERFERLQDWVLFWGPALNNRARASVTGRHLAKLFRQMRKVLQAAGLVDEIDDVAYFTVDDLRVIAATGSS